MTIQTRLPVGAAPWHALPTITVTTELGVEPEHGLSGAEALRRLAEGGPNQLPDPPSRPWWALLADQFRNVLVMVLLGAAVLAGLVGDFKDSIVIAVVLSLNAVLGFAQEHRAERSLAALRAMLVPTARVRRDSIVREVPAAELVPGDVLLVEAGDRIPADGRLLLAASLEVDESTLTGESTPTIKTTLPAETGAAVADRSGSVFMNTVVTRGRGEVVVHATGPATEVGKLAGLLAAAPIRPTPLQVQLHALGKRLALVAAAAVVLFSVVSVLRGEPLDELVLELVALAVAAIPEGLPAVVTVTLAVGTAQLAKRGAIVRRLASVETLGATSVICSDKTGTLTLNQMTARELLARGRRFTATGDGYRPTGRLQAADGGSATDAWAALVPFVLCNDATITPDGKLIGDPTEGALVALAAKGGLDVPAERARSPRLAEVPFDSTTKLMATFHQDGANRVIHAKGALDALLPRCTYLSRPDRSIPLDDAALSDLHAAADTMARQGLRVLAAATAQLNGDVNLGEGDPIHHLSGLTLTGLVGLLDPARPEARDAISVCKRAGVKVVMITGDHATTATAIARQLGIDGEVLTGADLDQLDDRQLAARVEHVGVVARVSPEHKVRMVRAFKANGHVVAMTGDGVNDAPALKTADIGVAMGITGTEVTKEAAAMVLTDDNFATIVRAVEGGRAIYANLVKFVRFQLTTNVGAILAMVSAPIVGLTTPFTALQLLWVNIIMDGPPAMALGVDPPARGAMDQPPRDPHAPVLSARRLSRVLGAGTVMAAGTLGVLAFHPGSEAEALTAAFTTFVLFQLFNALNVRGEHHSAFSRDTLRNAKLWAALAGVLTLQVLAVHIGSLQGLFDTTSLSLGDWALAALVASTVLWAEETRKLITRHNTPNPGAPA